MIFWNIFDSKLQLLISILLLFYLWFKHKFSYWISKGVFGPAPVFPFGNIEYVVKRKAQFFEPYCETYFKYKHLPYVGMYSFHRPVLCINDVELAKLVLIKDFDHFQAHGIFSGGVGDPLAGHLFNLHGSAWRNLRSKMSPTFSTNKLKTMYPLVEEIASKALSYVDRIYEKGQSLNVSELYEKYTMNIVANIGFGVDCNGFDDDSEFCLRGKQYFEPKSLYWTLIRALAFFAPDLFNRLKVNRIDPEILNFFYKLVKETTDYRQKHSYKRNDFLQTLIELKNGEIIDEKGEITYVNGFSFSIHDVAANAMLYLFAGYETSATAGQFAVYELAMNPHIQTRAREEVRKVLRKYNGEYTFEAQNEMVYINMVLEESLRKYPPLRALFRGCTKDYRMPNDVVIDKGTLVFVPVQSIQMDPDIFPEPDKFDPERFLPENKSKLHPCHWIPFGEGPRKCLGLRQGYVQAKIALVKLLNKYEFTLDERTPVPMKLKASSLACAPDGGVWVSLKKLAD